VSALETEILSGKLLWSVRMFAYRTWNRPSLITTVPGNYTTSAANWFTKCYRHNLNKLQSCQNRTKVSSWATTFYTRCSLDWITVFLAQKINTARNAERWWQTINILDNWCSFPSRDRVYSSLTYPGCICDSHGTLSNGLLSFFPYHVWSFTSTPPNIFTAWCLAYIFTVSLYLSRAR
jgi:hypothetical protein